MRRAFASWALVLTSSAAFAAPAIDVDGWGPSISISMTGATPMHEVMIVTGDVGSTTTLTTGPCVGTTLDLGHADERRNHVVTTRTDADGALTFTPASLGHDACTESVQGLDLTTCEVTPVAPMTIDCSATHLEDGLLAYWPGNDNARDVVGRHDGTIEGRVDYVPGMAGDAFEFDGAGAVKIRPTEDLEFADGEPFTWGMWIYEESSWGQHLFGKRHGCASGGAFDYQFYSEPYGTSHWGPDSCAAPITREPEIDTWQYLVGMYDGTKFDLYLDGELVSSSGDCVGDVMNGFGAEFRIGRSGTCAGWVGLVDEVMLWNRTLSSDEILCLSAP
jgi:hypothetical protein